ncbi:MAG: ATP-binding protein [Kiritimatiellae bacterium]|nr:ATP-binding protein [Kiritimatiellia bacterium]MDD5521479.1 ATP-binding protein [Kiritimatiellia bacterium]
MQNNEEIAVKDECAKTMRIDIHPDFLGESLARKNRESRTEVKSDTLVMTTGKVKECRRSPEYEKLLQSIYDAVLITDAKGRIIDFNSRAVDFILCDENELEGSSILGLISGADESLLTAIRQNLQDHRYTLIEAFCVRRDKSTFPGEIAVNKINLDKDGQLCFFVRDVTVRKRAQDALEDAFRRLAEHDRARSQFVSNVSHELRTPLTSMIYSVANMLGGVVGPISERVRKYLELLDGDCKRLLGTVNDILDLRKIEMKTFTLAKTRVPFYRLVNRSSGSLRVQAEQREVTLNIQPAGGMWFVECDAQKFERVMVNVVGNAVKFTQPGGTVTVSISDDLEHAGYVLVKVKDTGIGIPAEALDKVMERYFTVGEQACGTGLGLAISKEIVEMHGGTIKIKSPPPEGGQGTVVYLSMPVVEAPEILIVDDDPAILDLLEQQIVSQGYRVIRAGNGTAALDAIQQKKPDAVILDLVLPEIDGSEVILRMKSDNTMTRIPVIVVTGAHVSRAKGEILQNFAIPAIPKPWQEAELLDRVEGSFLGSAALSK